MASSDVQQLWATSLGQGGGSGLGSIESGNAVATSPDGSLLYITRNNGRLDVLGSASGETIFSYTPVSISSLPVTCKGGVTFGTDMGGNTIAAYAVVDKAPASSGVDEGEMSRVVVVSASGTIQLLYESEALEGVIESVVITQGTYPGRFVFLTRNTRTGSADEPLLGHFTVVDIEDQVVVFTESSTEVDGIIAPYGPIGVSASPLFGGKYVGGFANPGDLAVWTSTFDEGRGPIGFTRAFQFPPEFTPGFPLPFFGTIPLLEVRWNAISPTTLSRDGQNLFVGIRGSGIRAWIGDDSFQGLASWGTQLTESGEPIPYAGTLSTNEAVIFYTSGSSVAAVSVFDGTVLWEYASADMFTSSPKVSPDDSRLYAISATDGIVALTTRGGEQIWTLTCDNLDTSFVPCLSRVQGDFSISPDGQTLYFGDIGGNVRAVQLGDSVLPPGTGNSPTNSPTPQPTFFIDDRKTRIPTTSQALSSESQGDSFPAKYFLFIGIFIILVLIGAAARWYANYFRNAETNKDSKWDMDSDDAEVEYSDSAEDTEEKTDDEADADIVKTIPTEDSYEDLVEDLYESEA